MKTRTDARPSGPVAMEITRHGPSQSHHVNTGRYGHTLCYIFYRIVVLFVNSFF